MLSPIQSRIENADDEEFLSSIESIECGSERLIYQESLIRIENLPIKNYWRRRLAPFPVRYKRSWHELRLLRRTRCKSFPHGLMWKASSLDCLWTTKHWPKPLTSRTAWCGVLLRAQGVVQTNIGITQPDRWILRQLPWRIHCLARTTLNKFSARYTENVPAKRRRQKMARGTSKG